jgi:hypothetical protein
MIVHRCHDLHGIRIAERRQFVSHGPELLVLKARRLHHFNRYDMSSLRVFAARAWLNDLAVC